MENENTVNAVVEEVVTPQSEEVVTTEPAEIESTESVKSDVATDTDDKPQSKEENAKFAEFRRKAEKEKAEAIQKAKDDLIAEQYGKSHGIYTEADFKKAMAEQKQKELLQSLQDGNVDPMEVYNQMKENDPEYQAMKQSKQESYVKNQLTELNSELKNLGLDLTINSIDELAKLPNSDSVVKYIEKGNTLSEAYFLANKSDIISKKTNQIQQDTIKQIEANGQASPGSLSDNGNTPTFFTEEQVNSMSQSEVNQNLDLILKSMKSW